MKRLSARLSPSASAAALGVRVSSRHLHLARTAQVQSSSSLLPRAPITSSLRSFRTSPSLRQDDDPRKQPRESDNVDVLIIGAGPAGLSAAIRLKQLANEQGKEIRVVVLEKGAEVGAHTLSGAVIEPRALNELIPYWKDKGAPIYTEATEDHFVFLGEGFHVRLPTPPQMHNKGNYVVSLGNVVRWLGEQATELGVEIYPATPAAEVLYNEDGSVKGVATVDMGVSKTGEPKDSFTRGFELHARVTMFGEGCRGSLTKSVDKKLGLWKESMAGFQTYGLGIKELWQVDPKKHKPGKIVHTIGWPMDFSTYGGSFLYHLENNYVAVGYVVGLDYTNPYLNPYREFQRWKHHPFVKDTFEGGQCISYGARALVEGGIQSVPRLAFPGGLLLGDSAGFINLPKIKGSHNAMKSGMVAAETVFEALDQEEHTIDPKAYPDRIKSSWLWEDLHKVRNIRPYMAKGLVPGLALSAVDTYVFRGNAPWTLNHHKPDHEATKPAKECKPIEYPAPDGKLSFNLLENVARSGTNHGHDQLCHLTLKDSTVPEKINLPVYAAPESRYCPAGVYEYVDSKLVINYQNCVHCKTCDIKDPTQNINWVVPESGGPLYSYM